MHPIPGIVSNDGVEASVLICQQIPTNTRRKAMIGTFDAAIAAHTATPASLPEVACNDHLLVDAVSFLDLTGGFPDQDFTEHRWARMVCAPLHLVDFAARRRLTGRLADRIHHTWQTLVAGTPPAEPLAEFARQARRFATTDEAVNAFFDQPRIKVLQHMPMSAQEYGPGLQAHQLGARVYRRYLGDLVAYGTAFIAADGGLHLPRTTPVTVEQYRLAELDAFWRRVSNYLTARRGEHGLAAVHLHLPAAAPSRPLPARA